MDENYSKSSPTTPATLFTTIKYWTNATKAGNKYNTSDIPIRLKINTARVNYTGF